MLTDLLGAVTQTFTGFTSAFATMILTLFKGIFIEGTGEAEKLSAFGIVAVVFLSIGMVRSCLATVLGLFRVNVRGRKSKKRATRK